jgi:hypothetical protein
MAALKGLYEGTLAERLQLAKTARAEAAAAAARAESAEAEVLTLRVQHEGMSVPLAQVSGPAIKVWHMSTCVRSRWSYKVSDTVDSRLASVACTATKCHHS